MTPRGPHLPDRRTTSLRSYLAAVAAVLLATAVTAFVPVLRDRLTFFLFWPTVFATSWFGGLGSGLVATALSTAAVLVLASMNQGGHGPSPADNWLILGAFCGVGGMGALMTGWRERVLAGARRAQSAAERARADAEAAQRDAERAHAEAKESQGAAERAHDMAERASRAKDAFLANISHELRTPLSPILTWARMLREGRLSPEQAKRAIEVIERNALMQAKLVEDILDVSRIVEGKLRLQVRPTVLAQVVEAAIDTVRHTADARQVRLQVVLDTSLPPISGDPERLQQVVWNLLTNAVKFTPKGGRVHVVLERVNSHVEIAVSDTGIGIAPDQLPHLFVRFWQADSTPVAGRVGLGLGLAIARHLVELHGGTITAESAGAGEGSTFTVKLPLTPSARTAGEAVRRHPIQPGTDALPAMTRARLDGVRVLLVDDEPDSNEVVRVLLDQCGAEVRTAGSTAHALEKLDHWTPDIIVTDVGMPGEDGYGLLARIRAKPEPLCRVPVVALTAFAGVDDRVRLLTAGFQMHVAKPADPGELTAAIASVVRSTAG